MIVDYEAAWLDLKALVASKRSHGNKDLALAMSEIEVKHRLSERDQQFDPRPPTRLHVAQEG